MVADDLRGARARRATSACSRSARDRATRLRCWRSSPAEVVTIERVAELAERGAADARGGGLRASRGAGRRRNARRSRAGAVRRDRRRGCRAGRPGGAVRPARARRPPRRPGREPPRPVARDRRARAGRADRASGPCRAGSCRSSARQGSTSTRRVDRPVVRGSDGIDVVARSRADRGGSAWARSRTCSSTPTSRGSSGSRFTAATARADSCPSRPPAAARHGIEIDSTFTLLDARELEFYRAHGRSLASVPELADARIEADGALVRPALGPALARLARRCSAPPLPRLGCARSHARGARPARQLAPAGPVLRGRRERLRRQPRRLRAAR